MPGWIAGCCILSGSGVLWGGAASTPTALSPIPEGRMDKSCLLPQLATAGAEERAPGEEAPPVPAGYRAKDLLASPPGVLATPPDLR